jgi:RNA polymerase sigma factor for flagellar operon FliA
MDGSVSRSLRIQRAWGRWNITRSATDQDAVLLACTPLVEHAARAKAPANGAVDLEDLIQAGWEGLIGALDRYDPARGVPVAAFVQPRIQGAIADELRREDHLPRRLRRWQRDHDDALQRLRATLGRTPTDHELASALALDVDELRARRAECRAPGLPSSSQPGPCAPDAAQVAAERISGERFGRALRALSARDRRLAVLLFLDGSSQREVARVLGISETRVRQLRAKLERRLREELDG